MAPGSGSVVWVGPVGDEEAVLNGPAVSPAANRWQSGILRALLRAGALERLVTHLPERAWPRGPLRAAAPCLGALWPEGLAASVRPWNLPGVREPALGLACWTALRSALARPARAGVTVLTYNAPAGYAWAARRARARHGVRWIPVIADVPDEPRARAAHERRLREAAGRVYLSWSAYRQCAGAPCLHLDGGVDSTRAPGATHAPPVLLFTGALSRYAGAELLVEAFSSAPDIAAELWICGKGRSEAVERAAARDPRVRVLGMVPEAELRRLMSQASAFVNPRPPELAASADNFPSKILEYLSHGRPVVSTWTAGLAPEYRDVLVLAEADRRSLAARLREVLGWRDAELGAYRARVEAFLASRSWDRQAGRLLDFVRRCGGGE